MKRNKGFTLIELLVVVAIIGTLATIVLSSLNGARTSTKNVVSVTEAKQLQKALEIFYLDNNRYPYTTGVNTITAASNCTSHPSEQHDGWNFMVTDLGDYLPSSFASTDIRDTPHCMSYGIHPYWTSTICSLSSDPEYTILFQTATEVKSGVHSSIPYNGFYLNCLLPL